MFNTNLFTSFSNRPNLMKLFGKEMRSSTAIFRSNVKEYSIAFTSLTLMLSQQVH